MQQKTISRGRRARLLTQIQKFTHSHILTHNTHESKPSAHLPDKQDGITGVDDHHVSQAHRVVLLHVDERSFYHPDGRCLGRREPRTIGDNGELRLSRRERGGGTFQRVKQQLKSLKKKGGWGGGTARRETWPRRVGECDGRTTLASCGYAHPCASHKSNTTPAYAHR